MGLTKNIYEATCLQYANHTCDKLSSAMAFLHLEMCIGAFVADYVDIKYTAWPKKCCTL